MTGEGQDMLGPTFSCRTANMADMDFRAERSRLALARPELLREDSYIGGGWTGHASRIPVTNPATGRLIGSVPALGSAQAEEAVGVATAALPEWRARAARERGSLLRRWYELIIENESDLARLLTAEQGKPLAEATGEVRYAAAFIEWFAEEARRTYGSVIPGHQADKRLVVLRQPVGVVGAITPWNFPAAMITRKVAPALAVGCTVVLKPSELTPFTALALAFLADEAGLPPGVFNVVTGEAAAIGEVLTTDPRVRKFTFTGSTAVGKMLAGRCMDTVKRVSLELGGNAPFLVFDDADLEAAVEGLVASKFRNTGQTCVCANRIYVHSKVYDDFARRLAARVRPMVVGDGLEGATDQGPLIDDRALNKVERHVADAVEAGAKVALGGNRITIGGQGAFYKPTILLDLPPQTLMSREETFGPVAGLIRFDHEQEALEMANDSSAGLAAYAYTRDMARSWRVTEALEYGMVGLNTGLISTEAAPFGGIKESGLGREGSSYGSSEFLDLKLMCASIA
jgi:succinate-semialdehyde dehydrogenase/glutarate-semialdehyde dehydrogenase